MRTKHNRARYVAGCRCEICRTANRDYQRSYIRLRINGGMSDPHGKRLPICGNCKHWDSPDEYRVGFCCIWKRDTFFKQSCSRQIMQ